MIFSIFFFFHIFPLPLLSIPRRRQRLVVVLYLFVLYRSHNVWRRKRRRRFCVRQQYARRMRTRFATVSGRRRPSSVFIGLRCRGSHLITLYCPVGRYFFIFFFLTPIIGRDDVPAFPTRETGRFSDYSRQTSNVLSENSKISNPLTRPNGQTVRANRTIKPSLPCLANSVEKTGGKWPEKSIRRKRLRLKNNSTCRVQRWTG